MEINKKVRSKKLSTRVDLTAMVSVSFLLIIFFMLTKELSKPNAMSLGLPDNRITCGSFGCSGGTEMRTLTVLLDDNDKMVVYCGLLAYPLESPKEVKYGQDGIRKELFNKKKQFLNNLQNTEGPTEGLLLSLNQAKNATIKTWLTFLMKWQLQTYKLM